MTDRSFSALSQRAFDLQKPGSGPNEWASKIQAMKQQVEGAEEDDHKRLEEEIAAARQARLRRSLGNSAGSPSQTPNLPEQSNRATSSEEDLQNNAPKSDSDRQSHQDTALQKLMGRNHVYIPDKLPASTNSSDRVSLASFIGGSASGPKLNKHAPQPNAHDPTQFIQPDISAPHPVFGKGGIAMPGLTTKKSLGSINSGNKSDYAERYHSSSPATSHKASTPTISNEWLKSPGLTTSEAPRNNADINRRSFTATPKSPSPALAARYAEKFEQASKPSTPMRSQTIQPSQPAPALSQRKSFSSLPTSNTKSDDITTSTHPPHSIQYTQSSRPFSGNVVFLAAAKPPVTAPTATASPHDSPGNNPPLTLSEARSFSATSQATATQPLDFITKKASSAPTTSDARAFSSYSTPSFSSKAVEPAKDTPLKRLMETNSVFNPDRKQNPHKAMQQVPVSLAAYIGGTAKGPRLNKHAPQPDAHDPTQFIQPDLTAPHPIFGRGGVAMPGMAIKKVPSLEDKPSESTRPSNVKSRWPPVTAPPGSRGDTRPVSPQKTGNRERTTSTPSVPQFSNETSASNTSYISHVKSSRSVSPSKRRERTLSTPSHSQYLPYRASSSPAPTSQVTVAPSYLARPIAPDPKLPSFLPQIPPATVPSPAFQKSPPPKDPTPSISRLKGRGFVQNMVKVSVQLESVPASAPLSINKSRPLSAGKGAVLDRWQGSPTLVSPTKSSPSPDLVSKSVVDYHPTPDSKFSNMLQPTKSLKASASLTSKSDPEPSTSRHIVPTSAEPFQRSRTPGVGSGTTMVLIKPSKSNSDLRQASLVDELGVQAHTPRREHNPPNIQSTPKKPLIHVDDAFRPASPPKVEFNRNPPDNGHNIVMQTSDQRRSVDKEESAVASTGFDQGPSPKEQYQPPEIAPVRAVEEQETSPSVSPRGSSASPQVTKHNRIPSTGNRATVMELAVAMADIHEDTPEVVQLGPNPPPPITPTLRQTLSQTQSEKRRSTYEKYSSIMLPPLKEEVTPAPSPAGTLVRSQHSADPMALTELSMGGGEVVPADLQDSPIDEHVDSEMAPLQPPNESELRRHIISISESCSAICNEPPLPDFSDHEDRPLPEVDLQKLLQFEPRPSVSSETLTISVDLLTIVANTAYPVARNSHIFYETEILVVVHRSKSPDSGLASTVIWCWLGKQCQFRDREDKKLRELATRYGTSPIMVHQLAEPIELVRVLGGRVIIRQGTRSHWSAENTTMHLVRSLSDVVFIDEHDFNIRNLCSAFSYCFTILGTVYVWHGLGSVAAEQEAALAYARTLDEHMTPVEMFEGTSDQDEIFWIMLGDDAFAQADYWKWRKLSTSRESRVWRVDGDNINQPITSVKFISLEQDTMRSVYIIDCIWELFVVVGKDARGDRRSIRLALNIAIEMSQKSALQCPFSPTVHALILPSKLPLDLQLNVRDLDEAWLNGGDIPDHMNIIPCNEALEHLARREWDEGLLNDPDMLPLGVDVSDLP